MRHGREAFALVGGTVVELAPARVEAADVLVVDGQVAQVGGDIPASMPRHDASGCIVMPALVVGHTHLYSALACGMPAPNVAPTAFKEILERVWWRLDKALDADLVELSALVGAVEAAKRGVAFVVDHHASPNAIDGSLDRIAAALDHVGIVGALCYETSDRDGPERRDAGLRENERFAARARASETPHRALIGAHAPFTLEDDTLDALADASRRLGIGIHVHVAEDPTDESDAHRRGTALDRRLLRLGVAKPGSIVAHAVHLRPDRVEALSVEGAWVVTNARSNMNNAVGLARASGPRVALGTDGIGADMIAEAQAHFFRHAEAKDGLAGEAVARLVGAQKLQALLARGVEARPRVATGERADLTVLSYDPATPMDASNLAGHVLFGWSSALVRDTIVGGRFVVKNREVVTLDERELAARARAGAARLWQRMSAS